MPNKSSSKSWDETIVDDNKNVFTSITIGNAQIGGSKLRWKDNPNVVIAKGDIQNVDLGTGSAIKGKTVVIKTNILDANPQTNGIVATYYFSNCTPDATVVSDTVDNDGDICTFNIEVRFK